MFTQRLRRWPAIQPPFMSGIRWDSHQRLRTQQTSDVEPVLGRHRANVLVYRISMSRVMVYRVPLLQYFLFLTWLSTIRHQEFRHYI